MSESLALRPSRLRQVAGLALQSFQAQWIFFVVPAIFLVTNWLMLSRLESYDRASVYGLVMYLVGFALPVGLIVMLVLRLVHYAVTLKPDSPSRQMVADVRGLLLRPAAIVNGLPVFAAMLLFNKAMVELKPAIPRIEPFGWDRAFMEIDRALHFGVDPWRLLQPLMGHDIVTFLVNIAYNFWFLALIGAWFWFGFRREASELRTRFFLAYMLTWWVGGGLLAVLFSSAGPVYYGAIGLAPDPYTGLMGYLHEVNGRLPIWALDTQQMLWDGYTGKSEALGISAFPSMHNASAAIFALAAFQVSRRAGLLMAAYALVILVGSVHLGWHYAVDGYAGIGLGLLGWWAAAPLARWFSARPATRRYNESLGAL